MLSTTAEHLYAPQSHGSPVTEAINLPSELRLSQATLKHTSTSTKASSQSHSSSKFDSPATKQGGFRRELLVRMNAGSKAADQLNNKDMFNISDSGGQPMFHEVLPVFVTNTMIGMLTVKLNESLDSHPLVEYLSLIHI